MKSASEKLFCLFAGFILCLSTIAQTNNSENTFSIKLNIPVIIDELLKTEYVPEKMLDKLIENSNKKSSIGINTKTGTLHYSNNIFSGLYENKYFPKEEVTIRGEVSSDHMMLKYLKIEQAFPSNITKYRKEYLYTSITLKNVPMFNGHCFFDKSISSVSIDNYEYKIIEISPDYYTRSHTRILKEIDLDEIPENPKLARYKFSIDLNMDGPPSFIIDVVNIRGADEKWEPPISEIVGNEKPCTPKSLAFYLDSEIDAETKEFLECLVMDFLQQEIFLNTNNWHILERQLLECILQEHVLNQTSLVDPDMKINSDIWKEEIAVFVTGNSSKKRVDLLVYGKRGAKKITGYNMSEENCNYAAGNLFLQLSNVLNSGLFQH